MSEHHCDRICTTQGWELQSPEALRAQVVVGEETLRIRKVIARLEIDAE